MILDKDLEPLSNSSRQFTARLDATEVLNIQGSLSQGCSQDIGRCYSILNGKVDPDSSDRRHGVCRVSNAEKNWTKPFP